MTSPIRAALNRGQKPHFGVITVDVTDKLNGELGLALADRDTLARENANLKTQIDELQAKLDVAHAAKAGTLGRATHDVAKADSSNAHAAMRARLSTAWQGRTAA